MRWVNKQSTHLTLKFLGDTPVDLKSKIVSRIEISCQGTEAFTLALNGLDVFPNPSRPQVIWTGLIGDLETLQGLKSK